mmetsp:Transcript_17658/g.68546  ORF Transcript_17658/g.68546 Transcript_17658/m.68546 type:complete len:170 (+) Transcript_17658:77-586(+)|eukprot:CAMPEP_0114624296 /NCGR_PEP_ID=MMETSP0168-20121206/10695_1 /TAXON_ID=95228 ORGANISM="Vannella sp., Strain DIVA3 517/6/12" /NCGR_SAMPLE_ID=MMETSP0168 /ASSEMBLY_ACC=CAM_ASM_000044 /LENGTH=169 /DNA_ID=CAMNT_0001835569 /DNA_START=35 /DNA_END=544 /DNA_ORIENTATION=+
MERGLSEQLFEELTARYAGQYERVRALIVEIAALDKERQQVEVELRQIQLLIEVEQRRQQLVEQILAQYPGSSGGASSVAEPASHSGVPLSASAGGDTGRKKKQRSRLRATALPVSVEHPNADLVRQAELQNMGFLQRLISQVGWLRLVAVVAFVVAAVLFTSMWLGVP